MPDLLEFAERLSAQAGPGEQVEVYVTRGSSTTVKAYDGEVESLTTADSAGVGVRVIADHRQGFAHAGSLDDAIATETLQEARDNARFGEPDEHLGLVEPDGVEPLDHGDRWRPAVVDMAASAKIDLALDLERRVTALDPRVTSVRSATYGDSFGERAIASSRGIGIWTRATSSGVSVSALATQGDETQIGGAHDRAREASELDPGRVADDAVERATRAIRSRTSSIAGLIPIMSFWLRSDCLSPRLSRRRRSVRRELATAIAARFANVRAI